MPKRIRQVVTVNGETKYLSGYTFQDLADNYVRLLVEAGLLQYTDEGKNIPKFGDYLDSFYDTYKQDQQKNTTVNRERIVRNHIRPAFGSLRLDTITTMTLQRFFNENAKKYSRETLLKIKNIMSPVFDAAVEDEYISRNPFKSTHLTISGKETVSHKAIPAEIIQDMMDTAKYLKDVEKWTVGLLCYTGMRWEEILGVRWEDISDDSITISRAVVHPDRNQPIVKCTKTKTSERQIPVTPKLKELLGSEYKSGYIVASKKDPTRETPMSYSESRRLFEKIRKRYKIQDYSAHDFRDTCATKWRENGMSLDLIARLLGHAKTETTERRYVKYRSEMMSEAAALM